MYAVAKQHPPPPPQEGPAMYPQVGYCTQQPPLTTGFPKSSTSQFYPPSGYGTLSTQNQQVKWSTGLCDCTDDWGNCCTTCWCPCVTFGQVAEIVDNGSTPCGASGVLYALLLSMGACQCLYACFYRSKLRRQYSLEESPCKDCLVHCCCQKCALCQEYRELKGRGYDMSIGWHGNMERLRGATAVPQVQGGMSR